MNHPEVAILSVGRIAPRPVVRDGEIVVRPMGTVAVTFDHRVVDGARAAEFGLAVIRRLESAGGAPRPRPSELFRDAVEHLLDSGALARPSSVRRAFVLDQEERRDVVDAEALRQVGFSSTSTLITRTRARSLRARWASRLSIRRAGLSGSVKKTSRGGSALMSRFPLGHVGNGKAADRQRR